MAKKNGQTERWQDVLSPRPRIFLSVWNRSWFVCCHSNVMEIWSVFACPCSCLCVLTSNYDSPVVGRVRPLLAKTWINKSHDHVTGSKKVFFLGLCGKSLGRQVYLEFNRGVCGWRSQLKGKAVLPFDIHILVILFCPYVG